MTERIVSLHQRLTRHGPRRWFDRLLLAMLIPAAWLYGVIGLFRAALYRWGVLPSFRAGIPVISVGNLSVGGTGKTPVVDYLVRFFLARGQKVAVVSRGYGGRRKAQVSVVSDGSGPLLPPEVCGDEPFLLARRNPRAQVVVARRRRLGVALAEERLGADIVILDDGFQHLAVRRDLDIVLLDAGRPLGNGRVLPAGQLREFPSALQRGNLFLLTRHRPGCSPVDRHLPGPLVLCRHALAEEARDLSGQTVPLSDLAGKRGIAFAGIADPDNFFAGLRSMGVELAGAIALPDHVTYGPAEVNRIVQSCRSADFVITTEKDGVKLRPGFFPVPCYQVPLSIFFPEAETLEQALENLICRG